MADEQYKSENLFQRLSKLFTSQIVVRKTPTGKLRVKDVDFQQSALTSNFIDRYQRMMGHSKMNVYAAKQNAKNSYDIARKELFRDYELMDTDPIISSALDIYSDESTVDNVEGSIIKVQTDNPKVQAILENLFSSILNLEFNLWSWIRNLVKYGDFFLKLEILDKYGIVNVKPLSAYEVTRLEDHDPSDPRLVQFEVEDALQQSAPPEMLENYEVAHFRLLSDSNFLPYGKSQLEGARKVWKQLTLMEDAMLIHRIMRAPEKRVFKLDIGNIPPNEVENFMQQIINKMKKIPVIDQKTGEYNLRYNIESVTEDYFLPVRGGDSGTEIDTLPGLSNNDAIDDIEYLRNKMMAALKIPKAFLGYEEGVGSKATLAAEDVRFARTIERLQKIVCAELINFDLELTNPSMIHEQEKLELLTQQIEAASSIMENKLFSREWIYSNIFEMTEKDQSEVFDQIIEDLKQQFRFEQIAVEGNDPAVTGEKDMVSTDAGADAFTFNEGDWGGSEKDRLKKDVNPHGGKAKDIADATSYHRQRQGKREFKGKSPLATSKGATLVKREGLMNKLKEKFGKNLKDASILNEEVILDE